MSEKKIKIRFRPVNRTTEPSGQGRTAASWAYLRTVLYYNCYGTELPCAIEINKFCSRKIIKNKKQNLKRYLAVDDSIEPRHIPMITNITSTLLRHLTVDDRRDAIEYVTKCRRRTVSEEVAHTETW